MSIDIGKVTVLGTGVLGSQIAFQCAYCGFAVTAYDISDDILAKAHSRFGQLAETYKREVTGPTATRWLRPKLAFACPLTWPTRSARPTW